MKYSKIAIIYNPNSTGDSKAMAQTLGRQLREHGLDSELIPTKYAGHARELAADIASNEAAPLIVSSSGDGGYHEMINGVMQANNAKAMCAVLPAGNANDHSRTLQDKPLSGQIIKGRTTKIDLIQMSIKSKNQTSVQYAHSYIGLGLTPIVATELNKQSVNAIRELWIVLTTFFKYRPFKIKHNEKTIKLDSLLFANINKMAKILTLAPENRPNDGKFEVIQFAAGRKWQTFKRLARAAVTHLDTSRRAKRYTFTTLKKMPIQLDGEVVILQPESQVAIEAVPRALRTVI